MKPKTTWKIRWHIADSLVWLANRAISSHSSPPTPGYQKIDGDNYYAREFMQSVVDSEPEITVAELISPDFWTPVTDENAEEIMADLQAAVNLAEAKREEAEIFGGNDERA